MKIRWKFREVHFCLHYKGKDGEKWTSQNCPEHFIPAHFHCQGLAKLIDGTGDGMDTDDTDDFMEAFSSLVDMGKKQPVKVNVDPLNVEMEPG